MAVSSNWGSWLCAVLDLSRSPLISSNTGIWDHDVGNQGGPHSSCFKIHWPMRPAVLHVQRKEAESNQHRQDQEQKGSKKQLHGVAEGDQF